MSNDDPIPFEQELANIKAYVNIEKMRLGDKLKVVYDIRAKDFSITGIKTRAITPVGIVATKSFFTPFEKGCLIKYNTSFL